MLTRRSFGWAMTIATVALSTTASAADYSWKWQTFWQPGTVNQQAFERFAAGVAEKSDGRSRSRRCRSMPWCRLAR